MDDTNVTPDAAGLVERLREMGEHPCRAHLPMGADLREAATTIAAQAAELQRLREGIAGAAISETVDSGRWSLTLHFGKGESACIRMRDAADIIRNLTGATS